MSLSQEILQQQQVIISGPCSAETREQVLLCGQLLAATKKVHIFRAGVWKPRTRPGSFEGVGSAALPWLQEVNRQTGLPIAIEIANKKQVELALEAGIHYLWIGARSTANPFSVQEIADALNGQQVPVMVKNPTNADVDLWTGAVERVLDAGIKEVALIHRGFSHYNSRHYRNEPMWQLAIEMRRRFPDLPAICDPSHISGNRNTILQVAQKAADLGYNGLMIEAHPVPEEAWTDKQQQISPPQLVQLLERLVWRSLDVGLAEMKTIHGLRKKIDEIDDDLLELLSKRMQLADEIGSYKKLHNLTILQPERWNDIACKAKAKMEELNLDENFINAFLDAIHMESIRHQTKVMNKDLHENW